MGSQAPHQGVLLAVTGDDSALVRVLDAQGTGLSVVRRCGDLSELLSASLAGLASLVVLDTRMEEVDRTVIDRLDRSGARGVLLTSPQDRQRWERTGWTVLDAGADAGAVCLALQHLAQPTPDSGETVSLGAPEAGDEERPVIVTRRAAAAAREKAARESTSSQARSGGLDSDPIDRELAALVVGTGVPEQPPASAQTQREEGDEASGGVPVGGGSQARTVAETARSERQRGQLVVVWSAQGAPGRTTIAASLAHGLASSGGSVLVDADVEAPSLVQVLGLPDDSSALATAARLATHGRLDEEAFSRLLVPVAPKEWLLSGLGRPGRWRELPPVSVAEVWERARWHTAWTVVDVAGGAVDDEVDGFTLEPGRGAVCAELVRTADVVVVVGTGDPVGVRRLLQLLADLEGDLSPRGRVEVVVNRVRAGVAGPSPEHSVRQALERFGGLSQVTVLPEDSQAADRCLLEGRSVLEGAPGSPLGRAVAELVGRIDAEAGARLKAERPGPGRLARLGARLRRGSSSGETV